MPNYFLFRSSSKTHNECLRRLLVGQKENMAHEVNKVKKGDIIFIHKTSSTNNIEEQLIEGPFRAESNPTLNIVKEAWSGDFPIQVKLKKEFKTVKISQKSFKDFQLNYSYQDRFFSFQIHDQIGRKLMEQIGFEINYETNKIKNDEPLDDAEIDFRLRFKASYRCNDGHYVRSKNEVIVDNWLFEKEIAHAYEKKIANEKMTCDFYIKRNEEEFYIEVWGLTDKQYLQNKKRKEKIYKDRKLNLINITENEIKNIDDYLTTIFKK